LFFAGLWSDQHRRSNLQQTPPRYVTDVWAFEPPTNPSSIRH